MKPVTSMLFTLIVLTVGPLAYFKWGGKEYLATLGNSATKPELKINKDIVYAPVTTDSAVKVYKWKDQNGIWQFGSVPPNGVTDVQVMNLQPNVNIMKPVDMPVAEEEERRGGVVTLSSGASGGKNKDKDKDGLSKEALEDPYNPENISDLLKNAKNIQNMLDSRQKAQESALDSVNHNK